MAKKTDINKIFEIHTHVNEIWITEDGHFHLHPYNGGEKVERSQQEKKVINPKKTD